VEIKGIINLDLFLAFIFVLVIFSIILNFMDVINLTSINIYSSEINVLNSISRSYEIISQISIGRDNEISLIKLNSLSPSNVSLNTPNGYIYNSKLNCIYIQRAVYIIELNEVGYIEVC